MKNPRENLAVWLRDAYAMEGQAIALLESQIKRLENYPQAQPRLREHLEETKAQRATIERCLEQLGESPSSLKAATMKLAANVQGMLHGLAGDEVLKHALGSHAFEQFEAGCYRSLSVAAEAAGEPQIAQTCSRLMEQEQAMAAWVGADPDPDHNLPRKRCDRRRRQTLNGRATEEPSGARRRPAKKEDRWHLSILGTSPRNVLYLIPGTVDMPDVF